MPAPSGTWEPGYEDGLPVRLRWQQTHARTTDPLTSGQAAEPTHKTRTILADLAHAYRHARGGLTASEAARAAGYSDADGAWKRVSDLIREGRIVPTGQTRPGPHGRMQRVHRWVPDTPEQDPLW